MRSSFRYAWSLVTLLLLLALVGVVRLAWVNNPTTAPQAATRPTIRVTTAATPSPQPTGSLPTVAPTVALGNLQRINSAGFAFRPPAGYAVEVTGNVVTITAESATGTLLLAVAPVAADAETPAELLADAAARYTGAPDVTVESPISTTVSTQKGWIADLAGEIEEDQFQGRIALIQAEDRAFTLIGWSPATTWAELVASFTAVLGSVQFFAPSVDVATPAPALVDLRPTQTPTSGLVTAGGRAELPPAAAERTSAAAQWRSYTNANVANAVAASLNTIWVATDGGIVAWNKNNGDFTKYTTLEGLAANRTTLVVNCPLRGFGVVFGSEAGLQIYDNQTDSWKLLNSSNSSMSFDDVSALHCDAANRYLIIGYKQHGLDIFDANRGTWQYLDQNDGLQNNLVEAVAVVGNREAIWVSSGLGISVLRATGDPLFFDEANSALETNQIRRMAVDPAGVVWLGAQDALYRVEGEEWAIYDQREVLASRFPSGALNGLAVAPDGLLWIGSSKGEICLFDPVRVQCQEFFSGEAGMVAGELTSLTIGADETVYYTTAGGGVSAYAGGRWRAFAVPDELLFGNEIHSLAQTSDGNLWIATERGIQALNPITNTVVRQFTRDDSELASATSEVLHAAPEGGIWFGAVGVSYFNGFGWTGYTSAEGLAGSLVQSIATDSQGRTWFGTESGLSIWNGDAFFNLGRDNGLPSDNIIALLADGETMWISAADGGLFRFEKNQLQLFTTENSGLPSSSINAIAKEASGALLLGHSQGLARFQDGQVTPIPVLNGYTVSAIATAPNGVIWVGTSEGLFYFDGENWTQPPNEVQPPSAQISALLIDDGGSVWIGARTGGLIRYLPSGEG